MDENSKLYPGKIKVQCHNARIRLEYDITSFKEVREEIDQFVNDTYIKRESFDKLKLQCSNYLDVLDKMVSINQSDIADYITMENAMDAVTENLIGEVIIATKKRFIFLRDRAYEMERYYLLMAMCSWLLPALVSYYNDIAKMYRKMAEFFNSKYLEYLKKEELYDKVETETAGQFSSSSSERNRVSALLSGLLNSFKIVNYTDAEYNFAYINPFREKMQLPFIFLSEDKEVLEVSGIEKWNTTVEKIGNWYTANIDTYCNLNSKEYDELVAIIKEQKRNNIPSEYRLSTTDKGRKGYICDMAGVLNNKKVYDDCSSYVFACLVQTGHVEYKEMPPSSADYEPNTQFSCELVQAGFEWKPSEELTPDELKKGDILVKKGHVEIFDSFDDTETEIAYTWGKIYPEEPARKDTKKASILNYYDGVWRYEEE